MQEDHRQLASYQLEIIKSWVCDCPLRTRHASFLPSWFVPWSMDRDVDLLPKDRGKVTHSTWEKSEHPVDSKPCLISLSAGWACHWGASYSEKPWPCVCKWSPQAIVCEQRRQYECPPSLLSPSQHPLAQNPGRLLGAQRDTSKHKVRTFRLWLRQSGMDTPRAHSPCEPELASNTERRQPVLRNNNYQRNPIICFLMSLLCPNQPLL